MGAHFVLDFLTADYFHQISTVSAVLMLGSVLEMLSTFVFYENGWEGPHSFKQGAIWGIAVTLEIAAVFIWIHVEADIEDRDRPDLAEEPLSCKKTNEDDSVNNSEIAV